jgi:hypothetical protein
MKKELFRTYEAAEVKAAVILYSLRQHSHCLRGGRGRRESWLPSFSLRRPPRRAGMGGTRNSTAGTSPRRSGSNESAA